MEAVELLREKSDIVEIIAEFLPLTKQGPNYVCCCPFHKEKTPSFVINKAKQFYHCFGCDLGGDVFTFLQEYKKLSFQEALEYLADRCGIKLEQKSTTLHLKHQSYELLASLASKFYQALEQSDGIKNYLFKRGLQEEDFKTYGLGLVQPFREGDYTGSEVVLMHTLGIISIYEGRYYFTLQNRISFTLNDYLGRVVAFAGRVHSFMNFKTRPKYINTKNSIIFNKSYTLYLSHKARDSILKESKIYIVEGYFDCIAMHKLGFTPTIATCGVGFNISHLASILKIKADVKIIFSFDNDEAGKLATIRALEICFNNNFFNCDVGLFNEGCKDIGEVLQSSSLKIEECDGFRFFLESKLANLNIEQKGLFLQDTKALILKINNPYIAERLQAVAEEVFNVKAAYFSNTQKTITYQKITNKEIVLKSAALNKDVLSLVKEYLSGEEFLDLKESYNSLLMGKISPKLKALILNDSIPFVEFSDISKNIKALYLADLRRKIVQARNNKDLRLLTSLNQKIAEVNTF